MTKRKALKKIKKLGFDGLIDVVKQKALLKHIKKTSHTVGLFRLGSNPKSWRPTLIPRNIRYDGYRAWSERLIIIHDDDTSTLESGRLHTQGHWVPSF